MRGFCREFGEQQRVEVDFQSHDLPGPLSADTSLCFFHTKESPNVVDTGTALRRLWGTGRDSSHGQIPVGLMRSGKGGGLGLHRMQERLKLVKGELSMESQPKRGTTIHARVPVSSGTDSMRAAG